MIYYIGQKLSLDDVKALTGGKLEPGWYMSAGGQNVYICNGCHKDGWWGYKVLDIGGIK